MTVDQPPGSQPAAMAAVAAPFEQAKMSGMLPSEEDMKTAQWAHLFGAIANLLCCGLALPVVAPLIAMLMSNSDQRGPFALYHLNQAVIFQAALFAINIVLATVVSVIAAFTCGLGSVLYALDGIPPLVGMIYPIIVGLAAAKGEWAEYAVVGEKVLKMKSPIIK